MSTENKKLTAEQAYQRSYYESTKGDRSEMNRWKWANDPSYRLKEQQRNADRRALLRAENADDRFTRMVESKRSEDPSTARPKIAWIDGAEVSVYTTGDLGREVGRTSRAIRTWLQQDKSRCALPGASVFVHGVAFFTREFCDAVHRACRRLYRIDARGKRSKLLGLVMEELEAAGVSYVPVGKTEEDRIHWGD